jgi:hypothetical protein
MIREPRYDTTARAVDKAPRPESSAVRIARQILAAADSLDLTTASEGALISAVAQLSEALRMALEAGADA